VSVVGESAGLYVRMGAISIECRLFDVAVNAATYTDETRELHAKLGRSWHTLSLLRKEHRCVPLKLICRGQRGSYIM
jgi:hypothetical protein